MHRIVSSVNRQKIFLLSSLAYAAGAFLIFPCLRYYVDNPDTISYITIAKKYAAGDFSNAINGYWSPLITWMLGFLLKFKHDEVVAFKILQLLMGWFALFSFSSLVRAIIHSRLLQWILSLLATPFWLSFSLLNLTPDLLFLSVVLFYLYMVSDKEFFNHRHFGLLAGVLGLLLYFSKSFGFIFFMLHFTIILFRNYHLTHEYAFKKHLIKNYLQGVCCFIFISAIWIYLLSDKYGHFTISETVSFNLSREVASAPEKVNTLPVLSGGLYAPVNATAVNAWEDPGLAVKVHALQPFTSGKDLTMYISVLKRNLLSICYFDFRRQAGFGFFLLLIVYLFLGKRNKTLIEDYFFSLIICLALVYGGYALILVHQRYIWVCTLVMLILSGFMIEALFSKNNFQLYLSRTLFLFLLFIAVKRPVKEILFAGDRSMSAKTLITAAMHPLQTIEETYSVDQDLNVSGNRNYAGLVHFASINAPGFPRDIYTQSSLLALHSGAKYYGHADLRDTVMMGKAEHLNLDHVLTFTREDVEGKKWKMEMLDWNPVKRSRPD